MSFFEFPHTRTYDSDLGWLIKCCETVQDTIKALDQWKNEVDPKIDEIYDLYNRMLHGDLPEGVQEGIRKWMEANAVDLIGELVHMVFFEINDAGHFIAYIPDSWDDITFNTTYYDIILVDHPEYGYGHLVLSY